MSTLVGHTLIGAAAYARGHNVDSSRSLLFCFIAAGLAITPDVDYIVLWLSGYDIEPRYTHSIAYCLGIGLVAWSSKATVFRKLTDGLSISVVFSAPLSHLALDLLVGVHPIPLFWPLREELVVLPFGVLPSAGRLQLTNFYLWRNLVIEMGILVPIVVVVVPRLRHTVLKNSRCRLLFCLGFFLCFVLLGASLHR